MPLSMAALNEPAEIVRVGGNEDTHRFLEKLGFVAGTKVTVLCESEGNVIVSIRDSRIAIGKSQANKIFVKQGV